MRLQILAAVLLATQALVARAQDVAPGRVALRPDEVDKAASKRLGRVAACYKGALERSPRSYGTIGVGFRVAPDGSVRERFVALSTLADPALEVCVLDAFEGVRFPAPGGFGAVARFGILLKTETSPAAALKMQEDAYRRAIRDTPSSVPAAPPSPSATPKVPPGFEGLDDREPIGPLDRTPPK